jgi:hypothetical protein
MSFLRHEQIYQSDVASCLHSGAGQVRLRPGAFHRLDESATGYSLASCTPALLASASPDDCHGERGSRNCQPPLARGREIFSWRNGEFSLGVDRWKRPKFARCTPHPRTGAILIAPRFFLGRKFFRKMNCFA